MKAGEQTSTHPLTHLHTHPFDHMPIYQPSMHTFIHHPWCTQAHTYLYIYRVPCTSTPPAHPCIRMLHSLIHLPSTDLTIHLPFYAHRSLITYVAIQKYTQVSIHMLDHPSINLSASHLSPYLAIHLCTHRGILPTSYTSSCSSMCLSAHPPNQPVTPSFAGFSHIVLTQPDHSSIPQV